MEPGETRNSLTQLRRGVLEYCVLALLRDESLYGFDLVRRLSEVEGMVTSEGTIYPLLTRLRKEGWVSTTWQESEAGPPRRYYSLTPDGEKALLFFTDEWTVFRSSVDRLLMPEQGGRR
jgi:PadR family transcriptional regulator, regulatory protein PadR